MTDPYLRLHAVNIYVTDQARSLDFYLNTLGFHLAFDARVGSGERLLAVAPPDGSAVLTLIQAKPDSPPGPARRPCDTSGVRDRGFARHLHRVAATGRSLPKRTTPPACRLRSDGRRRRSISGALDNRTGPIRVGRRLHALRGRRSELVRPGELRRSQPRGRSAASRRRREAGGRAARRPRARDRHAGAGAALPSAASADAHAGVRRRMRPDAPGGRRLLRFPRSWAGPSGPGHRRHRRQGHACRAADGQPPGQSAESMRYGGRSARALPADREPALLREYRPTMPTRPFSIRSSTTGRDACATRTADICRRWCCDAPARSNGSSRRQRCWECSPRGSAGRRSSGSPLEIF